MQSRRLLPCVSALLTAGLYVVLAASSASGTETPVLNPGTFSNPQEPYSVNGGTFKLVPIDVSGASASIVVDHGGTRIFQTTLTLSLSGNPSDTFATGAAISVSSPGMQKYYNNTDRYDSPTLSISSSENAYYRFGGNVTTHTVTATVTLQDYKADYSWPSQATSKTFTLTP